MLPSASMLRLAPLLVLLAVPACTVATAERNKVVITDNKAVVEPCTKVADLDGSHPAGSVLLRDPKRDAAISRLKTDAAALGATHVQASVADIKWKGPDTSGVAYRCGTKR